MIEKIINSFKEVGSTEEQKNEETAVGGSMNQRGFCVCLFLKVRDIVC